MIHFLQMGGYARYVWPAFVPAFIVLALNIAWARRSLRDAQAEARRRVLSSPSAPLREPQGPRP